MKLAMYSSRSAPRLGVVLDHRVVDLNGAGRRFLRETGDDAAGSALADALLPADSIDLLAGGRRSREAAHEVLEWTRSCLSSGDAPLGVFGEQVVFDLEDVTLHAPVVDPPKILCVGLNYRDHAEEQEIRIPRNPILFSKYTRSLIGHRQAIEHPSVTEQLDFEAELAVVIGRPGRFVTEADALDHVAGYCAFNDVTSRDVQLGDRQWLRGKMGDTHAPMGPWLVTGDEIADPHDLDIRLTLNGEEMQASNTKQLIFGVSHLVSFISQSVTLEVGDVIATGTPGGVGFVRDPAVFMHPGDVVEVSIEGLGTLSNPVVEEAPHR